MQIIENETKEKSGEEQTGRKAMLGLLEAILLLLAGVGVFIVGMNMLSDGLEKSAGGGLKRLLGKISGNRFAGVGIGACVTAIIQSSSATSVMVIGFVNAGIMTLFQGVSIVLGASIGTTVTGIIVSLQSLPISDFVMLLTFVGIMLTFIKKEKVKQIGGILCGFGLIFVGLELMGNSLRNSEDINNFFIGLFKKIDFPLLLILCGALFTALIQSSSAATGIFITMVGTGSLEMSAAIFLVMGANIGTCITGVLASLGAAPNAKRVAFVQVLSKLFGMVLFTAIVWPLQDKVVTLLQRIPGEATMQIAWFHVIFNVVTTACLLPFISQLIKLSNFFIKDKAVETETRTFRYVDDRFLKTPAIAMMQVKKEIEYMGQLAMQNIAASFKALEGNVDAFVPAIAENEETIDFTNKALTRYLIKLSSLVDASEEKSIGSYFHVLNDLERIGDHAENFGEIATEMQGKGLTFSENARAELKDMQEKIIRMFEIAQKAFDDGESTPLAELTALENEVDDLKRTLTAKHYARLAEGNCKVELSPYFSSYVTGLERVADHLVNVGYSILNPTGSQSEAKAALQKN